MYFVRDQTLQPFSSASPWNTMLGANATYQSGTDPETALYRNRNAGAPNGYAYPWIAAHALAVVQAKATDPIVTWAYKTRPGTMPAGILGPASGGTFRMHTPMGMKFMGSDAEAVVIDPTGRFAIEAWLGWSNGTTCGCTYVVQTDLFGTGFSTTPGASEGIRAAGCSLLGGLVRAGELAANNINHALALALSQTQVSRAGIVSPATTTDGNGRNNHSGLIPMGARFAIPPTVSIASMGLKTQEGFTLARAFQHFGGIVVDTATNTNMGACLEESVPDTAYNALQADYPTILSTLCMVTSLGSRPVNGGPLPLPEQ